MTTVLLILFFIFGGVALMAMLGERFTKSEDPQQLARLQRWLAPLVGLMLVLSLLDYYL
ncbi:MAG: hypothetical protein P8J79_01940 [Halioglobus sp.]|nr:hypothetical protein [Halioglobus sp.]